MQISRSEEWKRIARLMRLCKGWQPWQQIRTIICKWVITGSLWLPVRQSQPKMIDRIRGSRSSFLLPPPASNYANPFLVITETFPYDLCHVNRRLLCRSSRWFPQSFLKKWLLPVSGSAVLRGNDLRPIRRVDECDSLLMQSNVFFVIHRGKKWSCFMEEEITSSFLRAFRTMELCSDTSSAVRRYLPGERLRLRPADTSSAHPPSVLNI